jgi:hypothetical protein
LVVGNEEILLVGLLSLRVEKIIETYHLQGKETMWWDQIKQEKHLDERKVLWR